MVVIIIFIIYTYTMYIYKWERFIIEVQDSSSWRDITKKEHEVLTSQPRFWIYVSLFIQVNWSLRSHKFNMDVALNGNKYDLEDYRIWYNFVEMLESLWYKPKSISLTSNLMHCISNIFDNSSSFWGYEYEE